MCLSDGGGGGVYSGGAVEIIKIIPVEEEEVPIMFEKISKVSAVTLQLHGHGRVIITNYCRK